ncbi:hypothetical protein DSECCO2_161980 [anaerobic digester metagenome]
MEQINNLSKLVNKNRKLSWTIIITYIAIFVGCAAFPIFPQYTGYSNIILHLANAVYITPLMLVALLGKGKAIKAYSVSFISLLIGMICRYLIEFGEVSNSVNFTIVNIVSFLIILPLIYTLTYYLYSRKIN